MIVVEVCCKDGFVIIMVFVCNDGYGGELFYKNMVEVKSF